MHGRIAGGQNKEVGMNETLRTTVLSVGIFSILIADGVDECKRGDLCGVVADLGQHTHEREPAPAQTAASITVAVSSSVSGWSGGHLYVVR
jgi:hypothetical protein